MNIELRTAATVLAAIVPDTAIQKAPEGEFVFVVGRDELIESRAVESTEQAAGKCVICCGVQPGERVVVCTPLPLAHGEKVRVIPPGRAPEQVTRRATQARAQ